LKLNKNSYFSDATMTTFTEGDAQTQQQPTEATQKKDHNSKASRNITLMVMFECALRTIGIFFNIEINNNSFFFKWNIFIGICPYAVAFTLSNIQPATDSLYTFGVTSSGILFFAHSVYLFVYLAFNKIFREVLYGYFKFKFTT